MCWYLITTMALICLSFISIWFQCEMLYYLLQLRYIYIIYVVQCHRWGSIRVRSIAIKAFIVAKNKSPWTVTAEKSLVLFSLSWLFAFTKRIYRIGWCRIELAHSRLMTIRLQILCAALWVCIPKRMRHRRMRVHFCEFEWLKDNLCRKNVIHIVMCSFFRQQVFIDAYIKYTFTKCSILAKNQPEIIKVSRIVLNWTFSTRISTFRN